MVDVPGLAVDATVNQRLVTIRPVPAGREFRFLRRNAAGNYGSYAGGVSLSGVGDLTVGSWMYTATAPATADIDKNGVANLSGASSYIDIADGDPAVGTASLFVGGVPGVQYCTAAIRAMAIWARPLSVLERDFAWQTFCPVAPGSMNTLSRATMEIRDWTDTTDISRASRVNPRMAAQQKFIVAKYTAGSMPRVQCSALVDDLAWPDTGLDGDLFSWDCYEYPAGSPPTFFQDAGISCIADVRLDDPGHYTIVASRANGGSVVLHLDAEEI
jgi:hypothetical protein